MQKPGLLPGHGDGRGRPQAPGSGTTRPTVPPPWVPPVLPEMLGGGWGLRWRECGETRPNAWTRRAANWAHFCQKQALAALFWLARRHTTARHPSTPRPGPTPLSFRTRSHNRREWESAGPSPPARLTGSPTNRSARCCRAANQRARGAERRTLPGRCPPQWAKPPPPRAAPAAAHPRLEPRSASFSQSLQCSWSFSSADGRGGLAGGRLTAVSLSSAILKRGLGACRTPATKRAAIGQRVAGHAGTGSLRGSAAGGLSRGRDYSSRRPLGAPQGGAPAAGGLSHTGAAVRVLPPWRRTAARPLCPPPRTQCPRSHPLPARGGGPSSTRAAPIGCQRDPASQQPIGTWDTAPRVKPGGG